MRKVFRSLFEASITWLYKKFVEPDTTQLIKEIVGFDFEEINLTAMSMPEKRQFLADCHAIYHNPAFKRTMKHLKNHQINSTMTNAQTDWQVACGRLSLYAVEETEKTFKNYSLLFEKEFKASTEYDKFKAI